MENKSISKIVKLREAENQYKMAMSNFNYAEPEYIDVAIEQLNEALLNLNRIRRELKMKPIQM